MRPDIGDVLMILGAGMVLAGAWLVAGLPAVLLAGGAMVLGAGWVRASKGLR